MGVYFLLGIGFTVIFFQDFRERAISLWTLPWIFLLGSYHAWSNWLWEPWFLLFNGAFVGVQLLGVSLYFSIKHRRWINITKQYLGLGDVLFFLALTPLFAPLQFCCFFLASLLLILLLASLYHWFVKPLKTIPLAGAMSCCWLIYRATLSYYNLSSYDDWSLLKLLYG
ncbi:MAG: prepilin peptidase [Aureispira sp.]